MHTARSPWMSRRRGLVALFCAGAFGSAPTSRVTELRTTQTPISRGRIRPPAGDRAALQGVTPLPDAPPTLADAPSPARPQAVRGRAEWARGAGRRVCAGRVATSDAQQTCGAGREPAAGSGSPGPRRSADAEKSTHHRPRPITMSEAVRGRARGGPTPPQSTHHEGERQSIGPWTIPVSPCPSSTARRQGRGARLHTAHRTPALLALGDRAQRSASSVDALEHPPPASGDCTPNRTAQPGGTQH